MNKKDKHIKPGYRLTEVGIIPVDWELKTYGEVFSFLNTAQYSRDELSENWDVLYLHYWDIHVKFSNKLDVWNTTLPTISEIQLKKYSLVKDWDLIMADASEDYNWIWKSIEVFWLGKKKLISGLHTFLMRDNQWKLVNGFRGYLHENKAIKTQFDRLATWLKVYGVSKNNLKKVIIPVPNKSEQSAIAQALSDTDALISSLDELIEKKKAIKQGTIQELLTWKRRLPGFNGEWKTRKISEIWKVWRWRVISHREINNSRKWEYPVYSSQTANHWIMGYIDTYDFEGEYITWTTDGENAWTVFYRDGKFNCTNVCWTIKVIRDDAYCISLILWISTYKHVSRNLANPKLMNDPMKKIEIFFPDSIEEQKEIWKFISNLNSEISELEKKRDKYKQIKQGMISELLTGNIRLLWVK